MAERGMVVEIPEDDSATLDSNEAPKAAKKPEPEKNDGVADLQAQVAKLNSEKEAERKRTEAAEQRRQNAEANAQREREEAQRARDEAKTARSEGIDARRVAIDNAIASKTALLDSSESEYAAAMEAGEFKKAAQAQRRMSEAAGELAQLKAGKEALPETATTTGRVERRDDADQQRQQEQPLQRKVPATEEEAFEQYVGQFSVRSQAYLRAHPECVVDPVKNARVRLADEEAVAKGYQRDSDAYFSYIDRRLGYGGAQNGGHDGGRAEEEVEFEIEPQRRQQESRSSERRQVMPSAPVRGDNNTGGSSRRVSLSAGEVERATDGSLVWNTGPKKGEPIGTTEYARRKAIMLKEGRYETPYAS